MRWMGRLRAAGRSLSRLPSWDEVIIGRRDARTTRLDSLKYAAGILFAIPGELVEAIHEDVMSILSGIVGLLITLPLFVFARIVVLIAGLTGRISRKRPGGFVSSSMK